jgi:hypothetical protein
VPRPVCAPIIKIKTKKEKLKFIGQKIGNNLRWGLVKNDIKAKDIFRLQEQGSKDSGYCEIFSHIAVIFVNSFDYPHNLHI